MCRAPILPLHLATASSGDDPSTAKKRGRRKIDWVHDSFSGGKCIHCGSSVISQNTTVKKKHLLNPQACKGFLASADAAANEDLAVVAAREAYLTSPLSR